MILKRIATVAAVSAGAFALVAGPASALVTFDPATGSGFVGKGDVQLALNYNNKQLNDNASSLKFTYEGITVSETSWVCTNPKNENIQERERTTTTETAGVVSAIARDNKKQITGFNLDGFLGTPTGGITTEGNKLDSCPTGWSLTTPAGDPVEVSSTGGLFVNGVALS